MESPDEFFARIERDVSERRARVEVAYASGIMEFKNGRGQCAAVTPDPTTGGARWRVTWYDDRGISGHGIRSSVDEVLKEIADERFVEPAPGTLDVFGMVEP